MYCGKQRSSLRRWIGLAVVVLLLAAVAGVAACGSSEEPAASPSATTAAPDLMKTVDEYMAAWNAHDPEKAATYLAPDAVYIDATVGTPVEGREAAKTDVIAAFINAAPDCVWARTDTPPVVGTDSVAYEWTFSGTNTGAWADGTKATGKPFEFSGLTLMRFNEAGEIVYQADYYDALNFFKQLGWAAVFWGKAA